MANGAIEMKLKENDNDDDDEIRNEMYTMADVWTSIKPKRRAHPQRPLPEQWCFAARTQQNDSEDARLIGLF